MPIGPRGPGAVLPGRGRGMGPPAEWNGRVGSAEQRGGFMQRAPPAGPAAPKTPADRLLHFASPDVTPCCPCDPATKGRQGRCEEAERVTHHPVQHDNISERALRDFGNCPTVTTAISRPYDSHVLCSDGDWRKAKEAGRQPEPTREWQQHGVGPPGRPGGGGDRRSDTGGGGVWDDEPSAGASRPRMTPAEMEEERKRMQEEFRNRKHVAVTHVDQGVSVIAVLPCLRLVVARRSEVHIVDGPTCSCLVRPALSAVNPAECSSCRSLGSDMLSIQHAVGSVFVRKQLLQCRGLNA